MVVVVSCDCSNDSTNSNAKIPVVIIDSGLESDKYTSFVSTDNYVGAVLIGDKLIGEIQI